MDGWVSKYPSNGPSMKTWFSIAGVKMDEHYSKCSSIESAAYWSSSAKCSGPCAATLYNMIILEFFKHHSQRC